MKKLSVVIPVFNSENYIKDCLKTIRWADEIISVDRGSSDDTVNICMQFGARVIRNVPPCNNFDINRRIGMLAAKGDWILKLDSDERLTKQLQLSIQNVLKESNDFAGFNFHNRIFYFNQEIKHGFKGDKHFELRLFKRDKWFYNPFKFHQEIKVTGKIGFLRGNYLHFNSQSIKGFIDKTNKYTDLDANKDYKKRSDINFFHSLISPVYYFFKRFVIYKGFLDKTHGLIVCLLYSIYNFAYKIKIWENRSNENSDCEGELF